MTLTIHKEEDDQRQLKVRVEVEERRIEQAMRQAARQLARDLQIPGFRRGRAPYGVILRRFGRDAVRAEAVEQIAEDILAEALEQLAADIYAPAEVDELEMEPLVFNLVVPLTPKVALGEYRSLRKELEPVEITEEAVREALEHVRSHHEIVEPVERPVAAGDKVTLSGLGRLLEEGNEGSIAAEEDTAEAEETADDVESASDAEPVEASDDNNIIFDYDNIDLVMDGEQLFFGQAFVDNIVGMSVGDEKSFTLAFPDDFKDEDYAGRQATFDITVLNVQSRTLPPLDDELAKQEGNYESLAELEASLREELQTQAENQFKDDLLEGFIDDLLADVQEMIYPPAALEQEIDSMVDSYKNQVERSGWEWADFLLMQGQEEKDIRNDFQETAEKRLHRQLVLRQLIIDEKLRVTAADIDTIIEDRIAKFDDEKLRQGMRDYYRQGTAFDMISSEVLMDKVLDRVQAILVGNAPDLAALEAATEESAVDEEE